MTSYLTVVLPLVLLAMKAILRSQHTFRLIDPKKKLEKGIALSQETIAKIQALIPTITSRSDDARLVWLKRGNNLVFKLPEHPQLVFKLAGSSEKNHQRFANMVKAKAVCLAHHLGLLVLPHARKFTVKTEGKEYTLIAEECLDFNPKASTQEELYLLAKDLTQTVRQMAIFIARTGFNDVTWRNVPILKEPANHKGPRRIGLIDIEQMEHKANGFQGDGNESCGLIGCVSKQQIDLVIEEAKKQGVKLSSVMVKLSKEARLEQLQFDQNVKQFHQKRGIKKGDDKIPFDDPHLPDFSRLPNTAAIKQFTIEVIKEINKQIAQNSPDESVKGRRLVLIKTSEQGTLFYGMDFKLVDANKPEPFIWKDADQDATFLGTAVHKLAESGIIFSLIKRNGHGYYIQA